VPLATDGLIVMLVAFVLDQVRLELCPELIVVGEAWKLTAGAL
jgi:hypothetical protein